MSDTPRMHWIVMLNQARKFAEHCPRDGLARAEQALREIDAAMGESPDAAAGLRDLREQALGLRVILTDSHARAQALATGRGVAYRTRIQREISGEDSR